MATATFSGHKVALCIIEMGPDNDWAVEVYDLTVEPRPRYLVNKVATIALDVPEDFDMRAWTGGQQERWIESPTTVPEWMSDQIMTGAKAQGI